MIIMKMGAYIKQLREEMKLSQEELGKSLNPPVNRAAVNKWETGQVENLKRTHIEQLARKFDISPCKLMCFDFPRESSTLELVQNHYGKDAAKFLQMFMELDQTGQDKILKYMSDKFKINSR